MKRQCATCAKKDGCGYYIANVKPASLPCEYYVPRDFDKLATKAKWIYEEYAALVRCLKDDGIADYTAQADEFEQWLLDCGVEV